MAGYTLAQMKDLAQSSRKGGKSGGRDTLVKNGNKVIYYVWGNKIAEYDAKKRTLYVTDAGWTTKLTKDRLNQVIPYGKGRISQKKFEWYINGSKWKGSKTFKRV